MGKKKAVKKTKEISVAIAESSSSTIEVQSPKRKRGRPRKIAQEFDDIQSKKAKNSEGEDDKKLEDIKEEEEEVEGPSSKLNAEVEDKELEQQEQPLRKSRRKSKPRKSS